MRGKFTRTKCPRMMFPASIAIRRNEWAAASSPAKNTSRSARPNFYFPLPQPHPTTSGPSARSKDSASIPKAFSTVRPTSPPHLSSQPPSTGCTLTPTSCSPSLLPEPETSWMSAPLPRREFLLGWQPPNCPQSGGCALFCAFLPTSRTQLFYFQSLPHSLPKTTAAWSTTIFLSKERDDPMARASPVVQGGVSDCI